MDIIAGKVLLKVRQNLSILKKLLEMSENLGYKSEKL